MMNSSAIAVREPPREHPFGSGGVHRNEFFLKQSAPINEVTGIQVTRTEQRRARKGNLVSPSSPGYPGPEFATPAVLHRVWAAGIVFCRLQAVLTLLHQLVTGSPGALAVLGSISRSTDPIGEVTERVLIAVPSR